MDEVLLYLSLKHSGQWLKIYKSLQKQEKINISELKKITKEINCQFITLISKNYHENLKTIYKPPFGIFCYGNYQILKHNTITIFCHINENNKEYLECLYSNNVVLLWPNLNQSKMLEVLNSYSTNNVFYLKELKNQQNKTYQQLIKNENITNKNAFISEVWQRKENVDYSFQPQERLYCGITKRILILSQMKDKFLSQLANYAYEENIKIFLPLFLWDVRLKKIFQKNKVITFETCSGLLKSLQN